MSFFDADLTLISQTLTPTRLARESLSLSFNQFGSNGSIYISGALLDKASLAWDS